MSGMPSTGSVRPGGPALWLGTGIASSARGIALTGMMLAEAGLLLALAFAVTFAALGFGLFLVPGILLGMRGLAKVVRQKAGAWCAVDIAVPYRPPPVSGAGEAVGFWRRFGWLLTDQATWRDLLWMTLDPLAGWVLTLAPAGLMLFGLEGIVMPAIWKPIVAGGGNNWYALIHVTSAPMAWLSVPLGAASVALGLWAGPALLRVYGRWARWLLAPARQAQLALRVRQLARTRAEAVGAGAAEMHRIERDLHDGAQARLVAMGMTLDAAGQMLDDNPAAARALLAEARDSSARALAELRDLVRGIYPPVLADRGLTAAVRALALDTAPRTKVTGELPGRPPPPVESAAYFATSELLANVSKHARARGARIDIGYDHGLLRVGVTDDGRGGADPARGSGLRGIERRLAAFDGILAISSPAGGPTIASMEIPCELSSPKTFSC